LALRFLLKIVMDKCVQQSQFFEDSKNVLKYLEKIKQIHQQLQVKMLETKIVFFFPWKKSAYKNSKTFGEDKTNPSTITSENAWNKNCDFFLRKKNIHRKVLKLLKR